MKLELLEEKKSAISKPHWKKLLSNWLKIYKVSKTSRSLDQMEELAHQTFRMKEWLLVLGSALPEGLGDQIGQQFDRFSLLIQKEVKQGKFLKLFSELSKKEKQPELRPKIDRTALELKIVHDREVSKIMKLIGEFNARKTAAILLTNFQPENFPDQTAFAKYLDERRDKLFNQLVEAIRAAERENFGNIQVEVEKFSYALELAVTVGFEKGKKLLQVLRVLDIRLKDVRDEERFREFVHGLENERSTVQSQVADIIWLRAIRNRLGLQQAETLRAFHAHIPVSLQVLKRRLAWK